MNIHIIACGGSVMHQLTIQLKNMGHNITCSDDEIFEPAKSNLEKNNLLPQNIGWFAENITPNLDFVIAGMHAKADNIELLKAKELGIKVISYPEFIYEFSKQKTRVAIAGSHGKTSTTSMVMHVLKQANIAFDYLVGAKLEGFEYSIKLSDAPIIILEADEYPDSAHNKLPKFLFYKPHVASISGIAWDHVNVFTTKEIYNNQFEKFIDIIEPNGSLFYNSEDEILNTIISNIKRTDLTIKGFQPLDNVFIDGKIALIDSEKNQHPIQIFGNHNLSNLSAAKNICNAIGITDATFYSAIASFKGAAKRLELIKEKNESKFYFDFAHAPSKVQATVAAVKAMYPKQPLIAFLELHTYSSLTESFLVEYKHSLDLADFGIVFYSPHALELKGLPPIAPQQILQSFGNNELKVFTQAAQFITYVKRIAEPNTIYLFMSSGNFGGIKIEDIAKMIYA